MDQKNRRRKSAGKQWTCAALLLGMLLLLACGTGVPQAAEAPTPEPTAVPVTETPTPTPEPTPEPTPTPTPSPTPVPTPLQVTIGAVGDIMIPSGIVSDTRTKDGGHDFHTLFAPFRELFGSVDLMCGNLEAPLAGKAAGYSTRDDPKPGEFRFNAPDSVLDPLKEYGVDLLTTGNNHCMDKGEAGLYRTVETIREAGFYQTGTFLNAEDREVPCIVDVNGIRVGFVAAMRGLNVNPMKAGMREEQAWTVIDRLVIDGKPTEGVLRDLARVRENGAEFVILFAHWDYQQDGPAAADTRELARIFLAAGADCIVGSHPHRVKDAEFVTVAREDGPYTGLVLYSLGNFTANNKFTRMVGLYAQLTLKKDFGTGQVTLSDAAVLPTLTIRRKLKAGPRFAVMPAYTDPERIIGLAEPLTKEEIGLLEKARAYALQQLGDVDGLRVLSDPEA
jgi:poly-gamma-glutamate synthesis protein (capsule biosynthesis protein)